MAEGLQVDAVSEDAANIVLDLVDGTNTFLLEAAYPAPERDQMWASSADTEGEALVQTRYRNRTITVRVRVVGSSASNLQTKLGQMQQKVGKLSREGGTLKRTAPSTSTIVFDVLGATLDIPIDRRHLNLNRAEVVFTFECKPFGRGAPVVGSAHAESTLPALVWTETGVGGDVPALGQLVVTDAQGADQWWLTWGVQSRYYDSAATAKLFYEAEDLTPLGGAATHAGPSGASGSGGSKVIRATISPDPLAILSTQASGGGAHLTHIGTFRVYARIQPNISNAFPTSLALEWSHGDFLNVTRNAATSVPKQGSAWRLADLGQVTIRKVALGAQRWEGRIIATGGSADTIDVDYLMFVPVTEGNGEATARFSRAAPSSFAARDGFAQSPGTLSGKTLPIGGTWAAAGDADGMSVDGATAERTAVSDGAPHFEIAGTTTATTVAAQVDLQSSAVLGERTGLVVRYTDTSNYVAVYTNPGTTDTHLSFVIGGVTEDEVAVFNNGVATNGAWYTLRFQVDANGRFAAWVWATDGGTPGDPVFEGYDSRLATGGSRATGKFGLYDWHQSATANTRDYDNFQVWVPPVDAAVFASQSAEVRYDGMLREDAAGAIYAPVSSYEGDYLLVPPAGREARTARFIVKASRNDPATMADSNIDDITATLTVTPRYLVVPE